MDWVVISAIRLVGHTCEGAEDQTSIWVILNVFNDIDPIRHLIHSQYSI